MLGSIFCMAWCLSPQPGLESKIHSIGLQGVSSAGITGPIMDPPISNVAMAISCRPFWIQELGAKQLLAILMKKSPISW
jgi:hypothetical protein